MATKKPEDKKRIKREEKRKSLRLKNESNRMTKARQQEIVDQANRTVEIRKYELLGLGVIFKILNGRNIEDTDKFSPKLIGKMCQNFVDKYKKMSKEEKREFEPLVPLAQRKIDSYKRYEAMNKKILQEIKEKEKKDIV